MPSTPIQKLPIRFDCLLDFTASNSISELILARNEPSPNVPHSVLAFSKFLDSEKYKNSSPSKQNVNFGDNCAVEIVETTKKIRNSRRVRCFIDLGVELCLKFRKQIQSSPILTVGAFNYFYDRQNKEIFSQSMITDTLN